MATIGPWLAADPTELTTRPSHALTKLGELLKPRGDAPEAD